MVSLRQIAAEEKGVARQRQVLSELNSIVRDIERCEKTMMDLQRELGEANTKYQRPRTTREDVAYLSILLACAKKKLGWEQQIGSLQKRTPSILEQLVALLNDPQAPPAAETRNQMLASLQRVQAAMERLQALTPS